MAMYQYTACDDAGKRYSGKIEAENEAELQQKLKADGKYLLSGRAASRAKAKPLKAAVLADFNRQFGTMIGAGVSMVRALTILANEGGLKPKQKELYLEILKSVRKGNGFSQSLEAQGNTFPPLMIYMYQAAEASGRLENTAMKLAEHYDKEGRLNTKVKSAFTYPKILTVLIIAVVAIIMNFVMPQFTELFSTMPSLPLATRILFAISNFVRDKWWLALLILVALVFSVRALLKVPSVRRGRDKLLLRIPKVGKLLQIIYTARFARTFSSLYACGVSIVSALQISRRVIGNTYIEGQFDEVIQFVRTGNPLSQGLLKIDGFSRKLADSVQVGEESGNLEDLLLSMADAFDFESETALNRLVTYLEPAMIIVMAVVVGGMMFAVIMPIYDSLAYIQ